MPNYSSITVRRTKEGSLIVEWPGKTALVTLELINAADDILVVRRDVITIGPVAMVVVGWDAEKAALIVERLD